MKLFQSVMRKKTGNTSSPQNTQNFEHFQEVMQFLGRIETCGALLSAKEIDGCTRVVEWLNLPSHHDKQKNWDTLKCLYYIIQWVDQNQPILDAGSSGNSAILRWLSLLGYTNLHACDIRPKNQKRYEQRSVSFTVQDLTQTNYPASLFHTITCISVIEHGLDIGMFLKEMFRIMVPGGFLLMSTDYWSEPVDCSGIYPYGQSMGEMKVLQPKDISDIVRYAESEGFQLCTPINLGTIDRAVRWERVQREFTFFFMSLRKPNRAG